MIKEAVNPSVHTHKLIRPLFFALGVTGIGFGYLGFIVPGMPSTVFFLISLWAFKRSSPRFETWLMTKSPMSETLTNWERNRSITKKSKIMAIALIWTSILFSVVFFALRANFIAAGLLLLVAIALTIFLSKVKIEAEPTKKSV